MAHVIDKQRTLEHYGAMLAERMAELLAAEPIAPAFKAGVVKNAAIFSAEERAELMAEKEKDRRDEAAHERATAWMHGCDE